MKDPNDLKVVSTVIVMFILASSCGTAKKMALTCPEPLRNYNNKTSIYHPQHNKKLHFVSYGDSKERISFRKPAFLLNTKRNKPLNIIESFNKKQYNPRSSRSDTALVTNNAEYKINLYATAGNSAPQIEGPYSLTSAPEDEVADFGKSETDTERADNIPVNANHGSEINYHRYSDKMLSFNLKPAVTIPQEDTTNPKKMNGMALAGFISSLVALLLTILFISIDGPLLIPVLILAAGIVLSSIGLRQIKKNPEKNKGKRLAIAGLIIGIVPFITGIIYIIAYVLSGAHW
jgi:hypothetical protein